MKRSDKFAQLLTAMLADFGASWKFIFSFLFDCFCLGDMECFTIN